MFLKIENRQKNIVNVFFILLFLIGLSNVKNYGISYDEFEYRNQGFIVLNYLGKKFLPNKTKKITKAKDLNYTELDEYHKNSKNNYKIQNTAYAAIEYLFFSNSENKTKYLFRHYLNYFVNFIALIFLYKIIRLDYSRVYGLLGTGLFISSPKLLPDFIYSPNDIWLLTFLLASFYFSRIVLLKKKFKDLFFMVFFICIAINVRYIAMYLLLIFFFFYFYQLRNEKKKFLNHFLITIILTYLILILITPQLWLNPFNIIGLFIDQLSFNFIDPKIMFFGNLVNSSNLPWYYLIIWILITTPTIIIFLFLFGIFYCSYLFSFFYKDLKAQNLNFIYTFAFFIIPILAFIIFRPTIFNGWRHFYFVYPFMILISVSSIYLIKEKINKINYKKILNYVINISLLIHFILNFNFIIQSNPYQNIYFNFFSKKYANNFELDYFGLSNVELLKYILKNEKKDTIVIAGLNSTRPDISMNMLNNSEKKRFSYEKLNSFDNDKIDYFLTHYIFGVNVQELESAGLVSVYNILVGDIKIGSIYVNKK